MQAQPGPIEDLLSRDIMERVIGDSSPAILICSDASGNPTACNLTAGRFTGLRCMSHWGQVVATSDLQPWGEQLSISRENKNPFSGVFALRRFDNAIRTFAVRAEPQFGASGHLLCHLFSGVDVTQIDIAQSPETAFYASTDLRTEAAELHQRLVSAATVVVAAADIIKDVANNPETGEVLRHTSNSLSSASSELMEGLQALRLVGRKAELDAAESVALG